MVAASDRSLSRHPAQVELAHRFAGAGVRRRSPVPPKGRSHWPREEGLVALSSRVTKCDLIDSGNGSLAQAEHVAVRILEPGTSSRADLGDKVRRLRRFVFLEDDPARGQVADDALQVVDLEVRHGLTGVRLPAR